MLQSIKVESSCSHNWISVYCPIRLFAPEEATRNLFRAVFFFSAYRTQTAGEECSKAKRTEESHENGFFVFLSCAGNIFRRKSTTWNEIDTNESSTVDSFSCDRCKSCEKFFFSIGENPKIRADFTPTNDNNNFSLPFTSS